MSLLKDLMLKNIKEEAASGSISSGAIAGTGGHEGVADLRREKKKKQKEKKDMIMRKLINEADKFDDADVVSKLKTAEREADLDKNTVAFGLEDASGNIIKVYVDKQDAKEFEEALESEMYDYNKSDSKKNTTKEIGEILFSLKDNFNIVNIEWPVLPEDEEISNQELTDSGDSKGELPPTNDEGDDLSTPPLAPQEDEKEAKSVLQQVIDVMKADAKAKEAEANARAAEAKAKENEAIMKTAEAKVKQEEKMLDVDDYYKQKSEEEKEAKRISKLAKYQHDLKKEKEPEMEVSPEEPMPESEEEEVGLSKKPKGFSHKNLLDYLLYYSKAQK